MRWRPYTRGVYYFGAFLALILSVVDRLCMRSQPLFADMFAAGGTGGLRVDLMKMKVSELREELEARDEAKSGCKPWLRRRLHTAIVRERVAAHTADEGV